MGLRPPPPSPSGSSELFPAFDHVLSSPYNHTLVDIIDPKLQPSSVPTMTFLGTTLPRYKASCFKFSFLVVCFALHFLKGPCKRFRTLLAQIFWMHLNTVLVVVGSRNKSTKQLPPTPYTCSNEPNIFDPAIMGAFPQALSGTSGASGEHRIIFYYSGSVPWNRLPSNVRRAESF